MPYSPVGAPRAADAGVVHDEVRAAEGVDGEAGRAACDVRPGDVVCPDAARVPGPGPRNDHLEEARMTSGTETGGVTGTQDKDYNLIWYVESCLNNALRLETYIQDAERTKDTEVAELFRKAQADSRKGAELGKELLRARLNGG